MREVIARIIYFLGLPVVWLAFRGSTRAYILLESGGKVLFVKSWFGSQKWKLPGGGIKKNENFETGVLRELYEETSIRINSQNIKKIIDTKNKHAGATYNHIVFFVQLNKVPQTSKPYPNIEIKEIKWLEPSSINLLNSDQAMIDALIAAGFEPQA